MSNGAPDGSGATTLRVVVWRGDPLFKLKRRFHTRERLIEANWRML